MLKILNYKVYDLTESVIASGNAMRTEPLTEDSYDETMQFALGMTRMQKLVKASNGKVQCHKNALCGILVSFDIVYPQYWSMEFQRYHFADIVTSSSKMHRLSKMDLNVVCNEYVIPEIKYMLQLEIENYKQNPTDENWMKVISNCPMGLELFMRVTTNYLQLSTIYHQRKNHRNKDWKVFCEWIESLPYAKELIIGEEY